MLITFSPSEFEPGLVTRKHFIKSVAIVVFIAKQCRYVICLYPVTVSPSELKFIPQLPASENQVK